MIYTKEKAPIDWDSNLVFSSIPVSDPTGKYKQVFGPSGKEENEIFSNVQAFCFNSEILYRVSSGIYSNLVIRTASSAAFPIDLHNISCNKFECIDYITKYFRFIHPYFPFRNYSKSCD